MRKTAKLIASAAVAVGVIAAPTAAFAGEVNGNSKPLPLNGNSDCKYSGLEDFDGQAPVQPGTVQNWGHTKDSGMVLSSTGASSVVLAFGPGIVVHTGCNAHLYPSK